MTPRAFAAPTLEVARRLVGCVLRHGGSGGRIVEVEAYTDDAASHHVTRPKAARALMASHGRIYVYSIYGMHLCLNFTTDARGPGAVLLRALEPLEGLDLMRRRRGVEAVVDLCRGPGRLAQALGVGLELSGEAIVDHFELVESSRRTEVVAAPRVGISRAKDLPWRFSQAGSPFVSRAR